VVEDVNDVPARTGGALYIVMRANVPRRAYLDCPCRCGRRLDLNLSRSASPCWNVRLKDGKASLVPSVWVPPDQCGSHFFVTDNEIRWVP
jgi:hypothetical protein